MLKSMLSLSIGQLLKINERNIRTSALTSGRQLATACNDNGYLLPTNVMDLSHEEKLK